MNQSFDVESFARGMAEEIWNRKNVGRLYDVAFANVAVHGPSGRELYGREAWMADILAWLAAFPDTQVQVEDIIWAGSDEEGYLVSERRTISAQNSHPSLYGPATHRPVSISAVIHYEIFDSRIRQVWREMDEVGLIEQLGLALFAALDWRARHLPEPVSGGEFALAGEIERTQGQAAPEPPPALSARFDVEIFVRAAVHEIWNWRLVGKVEDACAAGFSARRAGRTLDGRAEFQADVLAQFSAFPDLHLHLDQLFWLGDGRSGYHVALRWTMPGTHTGPSNFGPPTHKQIRLQGLSQLLVRRRKIVREWTEAGLLGLWDAIGQRPALQEECPDEAEHDPEP